VKYALFLGCTIPVRGQNYEMSAREVAKKIGIEFVDITDFSCCGFPVKSTNVEASLVIAARNIAIAAKKGEKICTLCNACTSVLTEANKELSENKELRGKINKELAKIGLEFKPGVEIKHFSRILYEDIGIDKIREKIVKDLSKLSMSVHYGCHYLRPSELYDCFDDAENPSTVEDFVAVTGVKVVDYKNKLECCGGAILGVTICPFCSIMYEDNQRKIESKFNVEYNLPVLYYPQVLGLALGIDQKKLGFRLNKIKAKAVLEKAGVEI
jgi:heterodisulfide reductase subunit B